MAELRLVLGLGNSCLESCFNFLTAILSNGRLSLVHHTMADLLVIRANHLVWTETDRHGIIESAIVNYMQKTRKMKLSVGLETLGFSDNTLNPPANRTCWDSDPSDSESSTVTTNSVSDTENAMDRTYRQSSIRINIVTRTQTETLSTSVGVILKYRTRSSITPRFE